ncbi:MAG: hypothetical protein IKD27_02935 [Oscillospiraceae bacterium]|nr:hypothetical protein [Oscillospiraceae bacterium]
MALDAFVMEIAGLPVQVQPLFETTGVYCRNYLTKREPVCCIEIHRADLEQEQRLLNLEADEEGLKRRKFPEPFLERSVIQRRIADALLERNVLMLHGSTVAVDAQAYLFTAACGTGKSTHTRLWRELLGVRAVMVNDDKPFLRFTGDGILACGSPWSGKHGLDTNISVPLHGICILKRGPENKIHRIGAGECREMLRQQCHVPEGMEDRVEALLSDLTERVALWEMECTKEIQAAQTAYGAMHVQK